MLGLTFFISVSTLAIAKCAFVHQMSVKKLPNHLMPGELQREIRAATDAQKIYAHQVNDLQDNFYVANITLGTPPQQFTVLLDTDSAMFYVPDSSCTNKTQLCYANCTSDSNFCSQQCDEFCCSGQGIANCDSHRKFSSSASSTYKANGTSFGAFYNGVTYSVGFLGTDVLQLGGIDDTSSKLIIPNATVTQATNIGKFFGTLPFDGILGLGLTVANQGVPPPIIDAYAKNLLEQPVFMIYLEGHGGTANNVPGGTFTYGGLDTENCGPLVDMVDVIPNSLKYFIQLQSVSVGDQFSHTEGVPALPDTGVGIIEGPTAIIASIAEAVGATFNNATGNYEIGCEQDYPPVEFTIHGNVYSVPKESLTMNKGSEPCTLSMVGTPGNQWSLGYPFMRQYCVMFNFEALQVGFAPHKNATIAQPADCFTRSKLIEITTQNTTIFTDTLAAKYSTFDPPTKLGFNSVFNQIKRAIWDTVDFYTASLKMTEICKDVHAYNANNQAKQQVLTNITFDSWQGTVGQFCDCEEQ
ncbi:eukaryotic aspartyl protease domain-containing protein [Ditylenchus destructor]|nr:eukaryotic aspartyl protease domain-containing protein [Ditylenchus destructor]